VKVATIGMFRYTTVNYREKMLRLLILLLEVSVYVWFFVSLLQEKQSSGCARGLGRTLLPFRCADRGSIRHAGKTHSLLFHMFLFYLTNTFIFILLFTYISNALCLVIAAWLRRCSSFVIGVKKIFSFNESNYLRTVHFLVLLAAGEACVLIY